MVLTRAQHSRKRLCSGSSYQDEPLQRTSFAHRMIPKRYQTRIFLLNIAFLPTKKRETYG
ncbi:hypothetical protein EMIT0373P_11848 [Pseudomonas chlororaphis]